MDFFQAQEFFQKMFPGKEVKYEFDEICQRQHEIVYTDGVVNLIHHVECNKVKVTVEGQNPIYVPIASHRLTIPWSMLMSLIDLIKKDVFIDDATLQQASLDETGQAIKTLSEYSGLGPDVIQKRIDDWKAKQEPKE